MKSKVRSKKAPRTPRQQRAVTTVDAILEAAARILEREGAGRAFGTNRIAREAGVSIGSLYEYFDSRDAIVRALGDRHVARAESIIDDAMAALGHATIAQGVDFVVDGLFALHSTRDGLSRTLHHEYALLNGLRPFIDRDRALQDKLEAWLAPRRPDLERDALRGRIFVAIRAARASTIHAFAEELSPAERESVRAAVKEMLRRTLEADASG